MHIYNFFCGGGDYCSWDNYDYQQIWTVWGFFWGHLEIRERESL